MTTRPEPREEPIIARDATYYRAPDGLRERLRAKLAGEAQEHTRETQWWRWGGMAASFVIAGLLTWNGVLLQSRGGQEERLASEVTTAHIRSLMNEAHLNDVASSDRHTVKPWFQGKLDFAPNVVDLAESGFPLTGGRLDYLNGRAVAALTFKHRLHTINLFEWPAAKTGDEAPEALSRQGYSILCWRRAGIQYWAITDGALSDLQQFAKLYPAS